LFKQITTPRLLLKPIQDEDAPALAEIVFSDPEVMSTMYMDTSAQGSAMKWAKLWINAAGESARHIWEDGGMGLFGIFPKAAPDFLIGVAGFFMERGRDHRWKGQFIFSLGSAFHDRGIMGEVADALRPRLYVLNDLGIIYGVFWEGIAPGAARILRNMGLSMTGRRPVLEEYTKDACVGMFGYDLWHLEHCLEKDLTLNAIRAAGRAGTFAAEGVMSKKAALTLIIERAPNVSPELLLQVVNASMENPGLPYLEIHGAGAREVPHNHFRNGIARKKSQIAA